MKHLKTIDWLGQTLILGGYALTATWVWFDNSTDNSFGLTTAFAMLCLGWWQMVSAALFLLLSAPNRKYRLAHFLAGIGYLAALAMSKYFLPVTQTGASNTLMVVLTSVALLGIPALLAFFYYYLTWRWLFPIRASGKFLPHISF